MWKVETHSPEEIMALGRRLGQVALAGTVFALTGEMGAGKTYFAKGVGQGLGVQQPVTSPTFTLINEYAGPRLPFYHMDLYRVGDAAAAQEIGVEDYFSAGGVVVLEWAELIADALPDDYIVIEIEKCYDAQGAEWRRFHIQPVGAPVPWLKEVLAGYEDTSR